MSKWLTAVIALLTLLCGYVAIDSLSPDIVDLRHDQAVVQEVDSSRYLTTKAIFKTRSGGTVVLTCSNKREYCFDAKKRLQSLVVNGGAIRVWFADAKVFQVADSSSIFVSYPDTRDDASMLWLFFALLALALSIRLAMHFGFVNVIKAASLSDSK